MGGDDAARNATQSILQCELTNTLHTRDTYAWWFLSPLSACHRVSVGITLHAVSSPAQLPILTDPRSVVTEQLSTFSIGPAFLLAFRFSLLTQQLIV